ncbi:hypothetical protein [Legionella cincinnatiensis]|uniref:Uncharacterized protein n=1 Tax=Legionella cincinnatiensis TaxID=28085 RepID=A0A378IM54_9GAMM|nr:hypothetical protein [Legionella cincinnatiensis]KTC85310.1 hypothetical protein Lcin_1810 [Legionella cincinnatiensis]STX36328.1 Uncharacterised protein [Legionella cincinnatiensis]
MSAETYLSKKLHRFDLIDYVLVMIVYFVVGLLIFSIYPPLRGIDWWFYLLLLIIGIFPLIIHLVSRPGDTLKSKFHSCVKTNTPALQVLLFLGMFFFSCIMELIFPIFDQVPLWVYLIIIVILSLKPLQKTWFW